MHEKFFALCEVFGAEDVGLLAGDASVNVDSEFARGGVRNG